MKRKKPPDGKPSLSLFGMDGIGKGRSIDGSALGYTLRHSGASTWRRFDGSPPVGHGGPVRNRRSPSLGAAARPYTTSPRRQDTSSSSYAAMDFAPLWVGNPASPISVDSRYGAFSPPQMVGELYVPDNGSAAPTGTFISQHDRAKNQPADSLAADRMDAEQDMDHNNRAWAPPSKASRDQ